ncbi:MAG: hypothetical protein WAV18_02025 [Roseiarcus sp.]
MIVEYSRRARGRRQDHPRRRFAALTRQSLPDGVKAAAIPQLYKQRFRALGIFFEQMGSNIRPFEG